MTRKSALRLSGEVCLVVGAYYLYLITKDLIHGNPVVPAFDNAFEIVALEWNLGLFIESHVQQWFLDNARYIVDFFNWFYIIGYWPVVLPTAIFLYVRKRKTYRKYRTIAIITFGLVLIIYSLYPLAPPRMLPNFGFEDTLVLLGPVGSGSTNNALFLNPYAAMPSLHFGMALIVTLVLLGGRNIAWKVVAFGYILLMLASIVVTGNHYFVDVLASVLVVGLASLVYALLYRTTWRKLAQGFQLPLPLNTPRRMLDQQQVLVVGVRRLGSIAHSVRTLAGIRSDARDTLESTLPDRVLLEPWFHKDESYGSNLYQVLGGTPL